MITHHAGITKSLVYHWVGTVLSEKQKKALRDKQEEVAIAARHLQALHEELGVLLIACEQLPTPRPHILDHILYRVIDKEGLSEFFSSIQDAYFYYAGQDRVLPWRDAPGAFRQLGYKIVKVTDA